MPCRGRNLRIKAIFKIAHFFYAGSEMGIDTQQRLTYICIRRDIQNAHDIGGRLL